ncbi:MAG: sulfotransferase family protein [Gammaproteobacteria bacterium]|nr:sulfotransferase family protein [Gammaproteobacteria bacterium]
MTRKVILHAHIFKNAGTSIDNILKHNYKSQFIDHRDSDAIAAGKQVYLDEYLRQHTKIRAFASHHLPLPLKPSSEFEYHIISMLRHPIVRAASAYRFERNQRVDNRSADAAKRLDFADYVRWHMDLGSKMFINYFIRYCTSTILEPLTEQQRLETALQVSQDFSVLGIVEEFQASMRILQETLAAQQIPLKLIESKKNVTDTLDDDNEKKLKRIESQLGSELYADLYEQNKEDLLFYESALSGLKERLAIE